MKKFLTLLIATAISFTLTTKSADAGAAAGGATELTQVANNVELIPVNISGAATARATQAETFFTTIMGPIANALIANMLQNATQDIISWVNGGFSGDGPQLIQNPENFIKKAATNEARKALSAIPTTGALSDSAFTTIKNSILSQNKDVGAKLKDTLTSQIPSTVQSNICTESRLTELSIERATNADGTYDTATALVEKEYLYGYFCSCDPGTDEECAVKLMDAYEQRRDLGGSRAWLQLTGGDNMFTKVYNANSLVAEQVATAKKLAENELYLGLGAVSETKCLDEQSDGAGFTYCKNSVVVNPGKAIQSAIETAVNAGTLRLTNIQGEGVLNSIFGALTQKLFSKGLNLGIAALSGGSNSSQTITSTAPPSNDLTNDPQRKESTVGAMSDYFKLIRKILTDLEGVDGEYRTVIRTYGAKVSQVKTCFDSLVAQGIVSSGDSRVVNANNYYYDRMNKITTAEGVINDDAVKIAAARDLINSTETTIQNTLSSQVISTTFHSYRKQYAQSGFPDNTTYTTRRTNFAKDKADTGRDTEGDSHLDTCRQIESSYWASQNAY